MAEIFPMYNHVNRENEDAEFILESDFAPAGDQIAAISELTKGLQEKKHDQVLLGVTGSGKTFTMAHIINNMKRPALIMAHNKTLAAQLYTEMKAFFPHNAVEYFVSYYDYYQPEAYIPKTDTFIEKDSMVNEQIDRMRHSATRNLLERRDTIVVASVSCIYGLGSVENYYALSLNIKKGDNLDIKDLAIRLTELQYKRNDIAFDRSTFRVNGDIVDVFPSHLEDIAWRLSFFGDELEDIYEFDPLTGKKGLNLTEITIFPASHYVTPRPALTQAVSTIKSELKNRLSFYEKTGKLLEAQRLQQRTEFDVEMITATGHCKSIENYSRHLTGRNPGEPPPTLFEYLPKDALLFIDESHVSVPQIRGMYNGDFARKSVLSEYGFRLPSCLDNRPLKFDEWNGFRPDTVYVSATPGPWEMDQTGGEFIEQVIRPTGLVDPICDIRPVKNQVDDLMHECKEIVAKNGRVLVTTLTKKMAEDLTEYLNENGIKVRYLHSDVDTLERIEIIRELRLSVFDVLVGINLLREGLDIPECMLVAILDADKEGFLRSEVSLIQTIGRAARNVDGRVILYADKMTGSMDRALKETERRRKKQQDYNKKHNITPQSVKKQIADGLKEIENQDYATVDIKEKPRAIKDIAKEIRKLEKEMKKAALNLEFEQAASLRDTIKKLREQEILE